MLLVILGAGSSYDSLPADVFEEVAEEDVANFRPPLAGELLGTRLPFGEALDHYPESLPLVRDLKKDLRTGASLEERLESYQAQAEGDYPARQRQFLAFRFYLQEILWVCGERWRELSHGQTNLVELLSRLDQWRHAHNESLCVVTFNYDLLLDHAAKATLAADLSSVEAYAADERYRFLKLHGSVNWGRRVRAPGGTHYTKPDHARRILIEAASELDITDDFVLRTPDQSPSDSKPYASILMPAITIPVQAKSRFECPPSHIDALDMCIRETFRILVIGWRGMEQHFLAKLEGLPGKAPAVLIVGASEGGTRETAANLASVQLAESSMRRFTGGFTPFLETDLLETFLNAEVQTWHPEDG